MVDTQTTAGGESPAPTAPSAGAGSEPRKGEDRFLLKAMREHASGSIDPALWAHAMAQARDDRAVATRLYLQSRATALRVEKRKEEEARRAGVVEALSREPDPRMAPTGAPQAASAAPAPQGVLGRLRSGMGPNRRHLMLIAGAVGAVVVAAGAFLALRSGSPPPAQTSAAKPASTAPAASARAIKRQETPPEDFAAKVRAMKDAGNWNLLVINAAEWTRRQPTNRDAWKELSLGYVQLRQWNDALDATKKAVEVAPDDLLMWQTLGQVYVNLRRPVEALEAFQRATALNERDVGSWVQQGLLNIQLRRLPDAKAAFERALAVSPGDAEALCGQVTIAQKEEREKDAAALTRQVASQGSSCPEPPPLQTSIVKGDRAVDSSKVGRKPH